MQIVDDFGLERWANTAPKRIAVNDGRCAVSYEELMERAMSMGAYLEKRGIGSGDRVLVCLPNCCEMVTLSFAAVNLGFIMVLGNIQHKQHELQHVVDITNPRLAVLSEDAQVKIIREIAPNVDIIKLDLEKKLNSLDFVPKDRLKTIRQISEDEPMLAICTSGSTGQPKGVLLSRKNLCCASLNVAERFHMTENDVSFVPVPMCHLFGFSGMLISILTGGRLLLTRKFIADNALNLLEAEHVTVQYAVATMYAREIECYENLRCKPNLRCLRTGMIAGSPGVKAYISWFEDKFGCRLLNAYGMTEAPSLAMADYNDPTSVRYSTCGRSCHYSKLAIIRDDGNFACIGEPGEIVCKGATVMLGYINRTEETEKAFTADGWFCTGDIGIQNPDRTVTVVGRKKDLIIRGGYNVAPAEVESAFYDSGFVCEACAIGYPNAEYGETIALFAVLKGGVNVCVEQLMDYAKQNIPKYKLPDKIILMDELPKLPNRKINKSELKNMLS